MKTKVAYKSYDEVMALPRKKRKKPKKPNLFFRTLLKLVSVPDLLVTHFKVKKIGMEKLEKKETCLFLMNHSSFVDLEIAVSVLYPRPLNIIATSDSFVGMDWLMRQIGCFPTQKFVFDVTAFFGIRYCLKELKSSVLMYPEASYSFDGSATPLPENLGAFVKKLGAPVAMIRTYGAFTRDPLYNNLQRRKTRVSAELSYLLSPEDIAQKTPQEIQSILEEQFTFDHFRWQKENQIKLSEPFRADYLNRVLYKCPHCLAEGKTEGKGIHLTCHSCGKKYELDEYGELFATDGDTRFSYVTDWYRWEREEVRTEIENGTYQLDVPVKIAMLVDTKRIYFVGEGRLTHTKDGFHLTGCDGKLDYKQASKASYSLYSDFNWYQLGDVICIGDTKTLYYCFPQNAGDVVAKTRLATEEIFKLLKTEK